MTASDDLIRRGDAIELARKQCLLSVDDLRALPAVQVAVKPLEWRECGDTDGVPEWRAVTIFGVYEVRYVMGRTGYMVYGGSVSPIDQVFGNDTAAKSAAQADYDARIRSALTAQPSPDVAELVALMPEVIASLDATNCNISLVRDLRAVIARVKGGAA